MLILAIYNVPYRHENCVQRIESLFKILYSKQRHCDGISYASKIFYNWF